MAMCSVRMDSKLLLNVVREVCKEEDFQDRVSRTVMSTASVADFDRMITAR